MPSRKLQRKYGSSRIGGNARVQLGDRQVNKYIKIERLYIRLEDELELPSLELLKQALCAEDAQLDLNSHSLKDMKSESLRGHEVLTRKRSPGPSSQQWWLLRVWPLSILTRSPLIYSSSQAESMRTSQGTNASGDRIMVTPRSYTYQASDLSLFFAGIMSCIFGQNVSVKDVNGFLDACQQHQLLGLLTCILGIGIYRYVLIRRPINAPSSPQLTLEDAYGRLRPFSIDVCADFDILTKFLEFHYRDTAGTAAGALIAAGQFHIMLGSRRGKVVDRNDWQSDVFKTGYKVVNSVYINKDNAECPACQVNMIVTVKGEFHCPSCKAYYRDCDTFRRASKTHSDLFSRVATPNQPQPKLNPSRQSLPPRIILPNVVDDGGPEEHSGEEVKYDVSGLIHVDLWIKPRQEKLGHQNLHTQTSGYSAATQGDLGGYLINNHNHLQRPQEDKYIILYDSLEFSRMYARIYNIARPLPQTCKWLRSHEQFGVWMDYREVTEPCSLWIKGKPGSGKSTIMKEILSWAKRAWTGVPILSYFFNARAPGALEKSSLGLYRSIIHQLLSAREGVRPLFVAEFFSKERNGQVESWTEVELQNFLLKLIVGGYLPSLCILVDALDEGDDDDMRRTMAFFETVGRLSISAGLVFRLCLSSRHFPYISIETGFSIVLEDQFCHTSDIELYIKKTLRGEESQSMNEIREMLLQRSCGMFLWVVLAVHKINHLHDRGEGTEAMKKQVAYLDERRRHVVYHN